MQCIVGLGNPGGKYTNTRHNAGFMAVDRLAQRLDIAWNLDTSSQALVAASPQVLLIKPQTFMNRSGSAVAAVLKKRAYALLSAKTLDFLTIVHDDLDIEVGKWKLQFANRPKTHNGLDSIRDSVGSDQYWYARIGVDGRAGDRSVDPAEYVLMPVLPQERDALEMAVTACVDTLYARLSS